MDLAIVVWAQTLHDPVLDRLMVWITTLGNNGFIWIVFALVLLCFPKTRPYGLVCTIALLLGVLFGNLLLKNIIARPRPYTHLPDVTLLIPTLHDWSFPSGHTCSSVSAAMCIWFWNKRWGIAAATLAGLITFSRLYLAVHYPTDLLGGALLGVACALAARWMISQLQAARGQAL